MATGPFARNPTCFSTRKVYFAFHHPAHRREKARIDQRRHHDVVKRYPDFGFLVLESLASMVEKVIGLEDAKGGASHHVDDLAIIMTGGSGYPRHLFSYAIINCEIICFVTYLPPTYLPTCLLYL